MIATHQSRFNVLLCIILLHALTSCSNSENSIAETKKTAIWNANPEIAAAPNRRISAYIFQGGVVKAAIFSNATTDSNGKAIVPFKAVDSNGCPTSTNFEPIGGQVYFIHLRVDGTGSSTYVYPTLCGTGQGFLDNAQYGYTTRQVAPNPPTNLSFNMPPALVTNPITLQFTGTGLNGVTRTVTCSVLDSETANPIWSAPSIIAGMQANITFTTGTGGTALGNTRISYVNPYYLKYACYIDANNSGGYNTGDLEATGTMSTMTVTISTWSTVP